MTLTDPTETLTADVLADVLAQLDQTFRGEVIGADSDDYEEARAVWNAMVDKRPALIVRPIDVDDVVAAVTVARDHGLRPSVRAGGHNVAGKALSEGGLVIDMRCFRDVQVDEENLLVHVGGGCRLGDLDAVTGPLGLVVPAGIMSETGVPGLALGGGVGWLSRKYGLTSDQFVSLQVVLASGEVVEASETSHPELFWALQGGGGNFGVVTRFTFRAHRFGPLMRVGAALYHPEDAEEALREYSRVLPDLPRSVGWHAALRSEISPAPFVPAELVGKRMLMLISMWLDDADDPVGIETVERLVATGSPAAQAINTIPFGSGVQRLIDQDFPDGHRYYTKEAHAHGLAEEAIPVLLEFWNEQMVMQGEIQLIHLGGAIGDRPEDAAAFSHREYSIWFDFAMRWDDPRHDADYMARTRHAVDQLKPYTGTGVYVNMLNFDDQDRVVEALGGSEKYTKLGQIKAQYDPENLFANNYNIVPVGP